MKKQVSWWQWVIIVIGLLIILVGAGRWIHHRVTVSKAPPASPEEAAREYQEHVLGYPLPQKRR